MLEMGDSALIAYTVGSRAQHFPFKLHPCPHIHDLCPPMPTHDIQKLCNVYYPLTPSQSWIGQIEGRSLSLASVRSASWLAYSMHLRSLARSLMQGCTKPNAPRAT